MIPNLITSAAGIGDHIPGQDLRASTKHGAIIVSRVNHAQLFMTLCLDRIDINIEVPAVPYKKRRSNKGTGNVSGNSPPERRGLHRITDR
jgi:hypothetical protein